MKSKNSRKIIVHILLLLGITITVFPFVWMILTSFKTAGEAMQIPPTIFPKKFLTDAYSSIVTALPFGRVYLNTIISTVVTLYRCCSALWQLTHSQESNSHSRMQSLYWCYPYLWYRGRYS